MSLKDSPCKQQGEVYGSVWKEERERRNNVIIIPKIDKNQQDLGTVICTSNPSDGQMGTRGLLGFAGQVV